MGDGLGGAGTVDPVSRPGETGDDRPARRAELLELTHDAIFTWEMGGGITYWNRAAEELYGYTRVEAVGRVGHELLQATLPLPLPEFEALIARDRCWSGEFVHRTKDGRRITVESRLVLVPGAGGRHAVLETNRDISVRKVAEERLRESGAFLRSVLDASSDCIEVIELDGALSFMNASGLHAMEIDSFETVAGVEWARLWPPESAGQVRAAVAMACKGAVAGFEAFGPTVKGRSKWWDVSVAPIPGADGRPSKLVAIARDVTARKEREAHLRSILATVPDAMVVIDEWGDIISFSLAAERLFGYSKAEVLGRNVSLLMPSPDRERHASYIARYKATGERRIIGIGRIVNAQRRDGSIFPIELSIGEARVGEHRIFTGFVRDLTERRRTEQRLQELQTELIHSSRLSAMGTMASTLAHELTQPLTAVANYVSAGRDLLDVAEDGPVAILREALDEAAAQSVRAGQIVRRLRDFVARGEVEKHVEPLARLIEEANALALVGAGEKGVRVAVDIDPAIGSVLVDRIQIQQVLINLVRNAIEAMEAVPYRALRIGAAGRDDFVEVVVADTGPGLDPAVAEHLFETFLTTKQGGLGLGLSICQAIVQAHGGEIWVRQNQDGGTAFHFTLPRADQERGNDI